MERKENGDEAELQPLFDSSISLPHPDKLEAGIPHQQPFGRLPATGARAAASAAHSRNASYGTSLLDT
ncbi:hypothetical protein H4S02_011574, partial [Coemansia sp. RSA 2611]